MSFSQKEGRSSMNFREEGITASIKGSPSGHRMLIFSGIHDGEEDMRHTGRIRIRQENKAMHTSKVCRARIRSIQRQQPARSILQYIVDRKHSGISSMRRCQSMICMILIYMHSSGASKMQKWKRSWVPITE